MNAKSASETFAEREIWRRTPETSMSRKRLMQPESRYFGAMR